MDQQHGQAPGTCNMNVQHENTAKKCSVDMQLIHAAWRCSIYVHAAWICNMDMQHRIATDISTDLQHRHTTRRGRMDKQLDKLQEHAQ
jgi:hypothetical protein